MSGSPSRSQDGSVLSESTAAGSSSVVMVQQQPPSDPKLFKTTLCQFYLQGPCKNGDTCAFAHGTSELRHPSGKAVKDLEQKTKTKLCDRFLQFGNCNFGAQCSFAHGVRELQKALQAPDGEKSPTFKTQLCKNYMEGFFCQFADKCQYAHGKHELRSKPTLKPEEISDDMKQRLIDKAQSRPDYKTKLCKNFEEKGACDFSDICHFAHGSGELREPPPGSESGAGTPGSNSIHFKTSMCKFADACQHGSACKFAHNESELRPSPHPAGGVVIPSTSAQGGGVLKTIMCKNYLATQQCQYGDRCNFAHSRSELNSSTIPGKTHPHQFQHPLIASASATMAISNQNSKYKTSLCNNWKNLGLCEKGSFCVYAHGMSDLRKTASTLGAVASPSVLSAETNSRFKTSLCLSYVSTGYCERGPGCAFAHGQHELRNLGTYKTVMCKNNSGGAVCPKGITCHYAHSMAELRTKVSAIPQLPQPLPMKRKQPVLKTALCQNFTKYGECTYGDNCNFAHGEVELQGSKRQRY